MCGSIYHVCGGNMSLRAILSVQIVMRTAQSVSEQPTIIIIIMPV